MKSCQVHNIKFSNLQNESGSFYSLQSSINGKVTFFVDTDGMFLTSVEKLKQNVNGAYLIPHVSSVWQAFNKLKG